jgi:hypothetical protein
VSVIDVVGLATLAIFVASLLAYSAYRRRRTIAFRKLRGFEALGRSIERAVEAGERVHLSLGTGSVIGSDSGPAFAGLAVLSRMAMATSMSDKPSVISTGNGAMMVLAQDSLRSGYRQVGESTRFKLTAGRMLGPTPFSYVAGLPAILGTEDVTVHMMIGSFGAEAALAADFGERNGIFVLAGSDDVQSQSLLYATAGYPLIGEEVFAGGAYLNAGPLHHASLSTQDLVRFLVVAAILIGALLRTFGVGL